MRPDQYENNAEGILCDYKNPKWLVCIKNWKPDNDIAGIAHLEIHHSTDEQFILAAGKAILITAEREGGSFKNIEPDPPCSRARYTMFPLSAGSTPSRRKTPR